MNGRVGRYRVQEGDFLAFQHQYFRRSFWGYLLLLEGLIVALILLAIGAAMPGAFVGAILIAAALAPLVIFALASFWLIPRSARHLYRESTALREETEITLDENGIQFAQQSGNWRLRWEDAARWDENPDVFAIFPNRAMAHILPKRDLPEELVDFARARLVATGLHTAWGLRK